MAKVAFKAKIQTVHNMDGTEAFKRVKVPALTHAHCDMRAFREHPKLRAYANSDLFLSILKRHSAALGLGEYIRLDRVPAGVVVDTSGFLAAVSFEV